MQFTKLDDSPMFRKQIQGLEDSAELLRERSLKFFKGCRKYTIGLGEGYDGDIAFANALETFGGGHNDSISLAFGGPVMTKYTIALREIGTYKELLRSQVEHQLSDKLLQFVNIDMHDVTEARKHFDKATVTYDQAREKYLSLKKGTRMEVATLLGEELHSARHSFEQARFNLVTALSNVEAKKRFELLEAVSRAMEAHLCYFKQGYELLHQMEPYINQILTNTRESREKSKYELAELSERMQEFKRQIDREIRTSSNESANGIGIQAVNRSSHKMIEAVMQSSLKGKVQTIRQGYLSKRSSNLRGDWKRRFFVLDSRGMLYYYRKQSLKPLGAGTHLSSQRNSSDLGSGLLGRWVSSPSIGALYDDKAVARHTVNLLTSTIKIDADQSDLRFCFRIISPTRNYTLQAENDVDQMDWIEKITGVIASLLNSQASERGHPLSSNGNTFHHSASAAYSSPFKHFDFDHTDNYTVEKPLSTLLHEHLSRCLQQQRSCTINEKPIDILQKVCGNNKCADCGAPGPDWASLNLGILVCIECSGIHRNLGVHISKVRSLTLDVKVWEPSVICLFQSLGNTFANSVWEELLQSSSAFQVDLVSTSSYNSRKPQLHFASKPNPTDSISVKEKFIHMKYEERLFLSKKKRDQFPHSVAQQVWAAVHRNDKKAVYRHIINSEVDVNAKYKHSSFSSEDSAKTTHLQGRNSTDQVPRYSSADSESSSLSFISLADIYKCEDPSEQDAGWCFLLHLACETGDIGMLELLLQYGANINASDSEGQTPLHLSMLQGKAIFAKFLLKRGAHVQAVNEQGKIPLDLAVEMGFVDDEVLAFLSNSND